MGLPHPAVSIVCLPAALLCCVGSRVGCWARGCVLLGYTGSSGAVFWELRWLWVAFRQVSVPKAVCLFLTLLLLVVKREFPV